MAPEIPFRDDNDSRKNDKFFMGLLSVIMTLGGFFALFVVVAVVVGMWKAGFINFLLWSGFIAVVALISKFVYRKLMESDWFE